MRWDVRARMKQSITFNKPRRVLPTDSKGRDNDKHLSVNFGQGHSYRSDANEAGWERCSAVRYEIQLVHSYSGTRLTQMHTHTSTMWQVDSSTRYAILIGMTVVSLSLSPNEPQARKRESPSLRCGYDTHTHARTIDLNWPDC